MTLDQHEAETRSTPDIEQRHSECNGCTTCAVASTEGSHPGADAPFHGVALVRAAAFFFLLPLVLAVVAAACAGPQAKHRSVAAACGLVVGMVLAVLGARVWSRYVAPMQAAARPPAAMGNGGRRERAERAP